MSSLDIGLANVAERTSRVFALSRGKLVVVQFSILFYNLLAVFHIAPRRVLHRVVRCCGSCLAGASLLVISRGIRGCSIGLNFRLSL
jgi:hypothetical protein